MAILLVVLALVGVAGSGCVYYNTYYLAKRYYQRSLDDLPYAIDKSDLSGSPQFQNAINLSTKVIQQYPKSKYVPAAYLLWAKSLIGNDDPRAAIKLLEEFDDHYPKNPLSSEAHFYLGIAYLRARKYERGLQTLEEFLTRAPKHSLVPYAHLERARALLSLDRPTESAQASELVLAHTRKGTLATRARILHADALFAAKAYDRARADYKALGRRSSSDEDRLTYLLKEAECLEAAQKYDEALSLLKDALAHEQEPSRSDTTGGRIQQGPTGAGTDHYGRLLLRLGTVQLRAGKLNEALAAYNRTLRDYPRTPVGAEAQYRIAYAYETEGEDFERARTEYSRVSDQGSGTTFADQAQARIATLQQLAQFRKTTNDTVARQAEAEFVLAEQYLFQLDKPDRALEHYRKVQHQFPGSPYAAKAIMAEGWVLSRKLHRKTDADSLFWLVVREHPATEAQLASRDYLEAEGIPVPDSLIKEPEVKTPPLDSLLRDTTLTAPPAVTPRLGAAPSSDSLRLGLHLGPNGLPPIPIPSLEGGVPAETPRLLPPIGLPPVEAPPDTTRHAVAPPDTIGHAPAPSDTTHRAAVPADTTRRAPAPTDTSHVVRPPSPSPH